LTPTPTRTVTPAAPTPTGVATSTQGATPGATPTPQTNPLSAKAAEKCQKGIKRAGLTFTSKRLKSLDKCVNGVLRCVQEKPGDEGCLTKATVVCSGEMIGTLGTLEDKFRSTVADKCESPFLTVADLLNPDGLGFDAVAAECASQFGTPLVDTAAIADCVLAQHECATEQMFAVQEPRAGELLTLVRNRGANFDAPACIDDHGAAGGGPDPKTVNKVVVKCEAQIKKAGTKFAAAKLRALESCVDAVFTCVVTKPGDDACFTKANATCDKELAKIGVEAGKMTAAIDKRCGAEAINYGILRAATGANLDALATECATFGVTPLESLADYEECIFRQHSCRTEEMLRFEAPRAEELLGLLTPPEELHSEFCPAP
jgi:hypothetical protein